MIGREASSVVIPAQAGIHLPSRRARTDPVVLAPLCPSLVAAWIPACAGRTGRVVGGLYPGEGAAGRCRLRNSYAENLSQTSAVIPAKAGIHLPSRRARTDQAEFVSSRAGLAAAWIPACAGMTGEGGGRLYLGEGAAAGVVACTGIRHRPPSSSPRRRGSIHPGSWEFRAGTTRLNGSRVKPGMAARVGPLSGSFGEDRRSPLSLSER